MAGDYCQLELRILCQLSKDSNLADLLNLSDSVDPFQQMANLFNTAKELNSNILITRDKAKQVTFFYIFNYFSCPTQ